jgi:glycosyltransferase involved in cell wall biosynthesis
MRIAQVAPLYESVPPKYYGGTERVVSYLAEELVRQGHEVTLFASGDSETKARLMAACPRSLRLDKHCQDQMAHRLVMLEHRSFSCRLPAFSAKPAAADRARHDAAWAAGYS